MDEKVKVPPKKKVIPPVAPKPIEAEEGSLASLDKTFPPIADRNLSLRSTSPVDLIAWAESLGKKVELREEAIEAILRHEYGDKVFEAWKKGS